MSREYTIEIIEIGGVYFPAFHRIKVKAKCAENAICEALREFRVEVSPEELEYAKQDINDDDYDTMLGSSSNDYIAVAYNFVLDRYQDSDYRLLRGYCGKRKCFDITIKNEYKAPCLPDKVILNEDVVKHFVFDDGDVDDESLQECIDNYLKDKYGYCIKDYKYVCHYNADRADAKLIGIDIYNIVWNLSK